MNDVPDWMEPKIIGEPPMSDVEVKWLWGYFQIQCTLGEETVPIEIFRRCIRDILHHREQAGRRLVD